MGTKQWGNALKGSKSAVRRCAVTGALFVLSLALGGCRIVITVPEGGAVVASAGTTCEGGTVCEVDVATTAFYQTFSAVAAPGQRFIGWRSGNGYLCGGSLAACPFSTAGFAGNANLEALLDTDHAVYLEPVFESLDSERYDVNAWRQLLDELADPTFRSNHYLFAITPDVLNCDPGVITAAAGERFVKTVNLVRKLHRLPPVQYLPSFESEQQQSALVQLANRYLSHSPSTSDRCYSSTAAIGAGSSNLSYRSSQGDPARYPLDWVNDNNNIANVMEAGHRRWVLYPQLGYTSYGQAQGYASMKVFGFARTPAEAVSAELEYVALPYRSYPWILVSQGSRRTPWSISMVPPQGVSSRFNYFATASVSVVRTADGQPLQVHSEHRDTRGFGLANFYSWMVDGWTHDTDYTVTIRNVTMPDGTTRNIEYPVEIDLAELL